jgi:bisphosphoglycerate-independent phosphoglycerate mutase (AlkP superfamily)
MPTSSSAVGATSARTPPSRSVPAAGGVCIVTADHGNADHMLEDDGSPNTAHSMNPVPLIVTSPAAWTARATRPRQASTVSTAVTAAGGVCIVTADHGNADHMLEDDGSPNTAHSMNPVPLIVTSPAAGTLREGGVLADVAPTALELVGMPVPPQMTGRSLLG